jgi:hypothetical protein
MDTNWAVEAVGYVASALIILSITQKSILRLRLLGLVGGLTFLVYSLAIGAYPIAVVNLIASGIHLWYLRKLLRRKDEVFRLLRVRPESRYLADFLDFHRGEIQGRFQPEFRHDPHGAQVTVFILRDMVPAGVFIGEATAAGDFEVKLDFVSPQYRDFRIARWVYSPESPVLAEIAPSCAWTRASNADHAAYLRKVGYTERPSEAGVYEIQLGTSAAA